jgi:RNA polymerase sigma factor FliA
VAETKLTEEKERELWKALKSDGDLSARDTIALNYVHLVKYVINRLTALSQLETEVVDYDDLYSTGILGLLAAIDNFDTSREVKFVTYAVPRVRGSIIDSLRSMDWLPRSLRQKINKLHNAQSQLEMQLGRNPSEADLADELGVSVEELQKTLTAANRSVVLSLNEEMSFSDDGKVNLAGVTASREVDPRKVIQRDEVVNILEQSIRNLPEKERMVVVMYYNREMTFKEIGMVLAVTESRICQLHSKAMLRLKNRLGEVATDLTSIV